MSPPPTFYWSGLATATKESAIVSLVNTEPSSRGRVLCVESFDVKPWVPQSHQGSNTAGISDIAPFQITRITSIGEGDDVPMVHLGGTNTLPSQVKCRLQAPVTIDAVISQQMVLPVFGYAASVATLVSPAISGPFATPLGRWGYRDPNTQGIVLREGYGLAVTLINSTDTPANDLNTVLVTLRDDTNGHTYSVLADLVSAGAMGIGCFALFNGAGSGVVLSVLAIERCPTGQCFPSGLMIGHIRTMLTRGDDGKGEVIAPHAMDPSNVLPSWARLSRGRLGYNFYPVLDASGTSIRTSIDGTNNPYNEQPVANEAWTLANATGQGIASIHSIGTWRRSSPFPGAFRGGTATPPTRFYLPVAPTVRACGNLAKNDDQLVIPPGRGFAIVANNPFGRNAFWVELAFSLRVESTPYARASA